MSGIVIVPRRGRPKPIIDTPLDIFGADLWAWYDADTGILAGDEMTTWTNKEGTAARDGILFEDTDGGPNVGRPQQVIENGATALYFRGGSNDKGCLYTLGVWDDLDNIHNAGEFWIVIKKQTADAGDARFMQSGGEGTGSNSVFNTGAERFNLTAGTGVGTGNIVSTQDVTTPFLLNIKALPNDYIVRNNGDNTLFSKIVNTVTWRVTSGWFGATHVRIGGTKGGSGGSTGIYLKGWIWTAFAIKRAATTVENNKVNAYLADRYPFLTLTDF